MRFADRADSIQVLLVVRVCLLDDVEPESERQENQARMRASWPVERYRTFGVRGENSLSFMIETI